MLAVQQYLKDGKSLEDLENEFGIKTSRHPTLPIFNLNYSVLSPQKTHPIVMECRSLCLDDNFDLVARSFPRFFNLQEALEINDKFNWKSFYVLEKLDGWFCKIFWYKDQWIFSSRSAFGDNPTNNPEITFGQTVSSILTPQILNLLDRAICYTFELVGPNTKIVKHYQYNWMFLLTAFRGEAELPMAYRKQMIRVLSEASKGMIGGPAHYFACNTADHVYNLVAQKAKEDKTWEGVVLQDSNGMRIKIKSPSYINLHHLRGEGNLFLPKYIIPFILNDDYDEVMEYWPEVRPNFEKVKQHLDLHEKQLIDLWQEVKNIESQKEFAIAIVGKTPFSSILFQARKQRKHPREIWVESSDYIHKVLY